jgi:hypothetical protein
VRKRLATLVVAVTLLAGCGGGVEGRPVAAERWDPCSIPDEAIEATGLDPAFRIVGWGEGIRVDDWSLCKFRAPAARQSYFLNVMSSESHTVGEARGNDSNFDDVDLTVGAREAFQYRTDVSEAVQDCNIAVPVPPGVVVFTVDFVGGVEPESDPCDLVATHAIDLEIQLPPMPG